MYSLMFPLKAKILKVSFRTKLFWNRFRFTHYTVHIFSKILQKHVHNFHILIIPSSVEHAHTYMH